MDNIKSKLVSNTFWSLIGQVANVLILLATNIVLAWKLSPQDFGRAGIVMFFITTCNVLTESGLSGALIRKEQVSDNDYSTVFVFNLIVSIALCLLIIAGGGLISDFYRDEELKSIVGVSSAILVINAFQLTQNAKLQKNLQYKKKSTYTFIATLLSSAVGIALSFLEFGVWAIVISQLLNALILTGLLIYFEGFEYQFVFSKSSFKELYKFGMNTTLASVIDSIFSNIYEMILGRFFSLSIVGHYYQAKRLQNVPMNILRLTTIGVFYSALVRLQNDKKEFNSLYNRIVRLFTVLMGLITSLIYLYSEQAIVLLYGNKWLEAVFFMKVLTIFSFFYLQEMLNRNIFKVFNKTEMILKLEIIKKALQSLTIVVGLYYMKIEFLMIGLVFTAVCSYLINYYLSRNVLGKVSYYELILLLKVTLIGIVLVAAFQWLFTTLNLSHLMSLILLPAFLAIYTGLMKILNISDLINDLKKLKRLKSGGNIGAKTKSIE